MNDIKLMEIRYDLPTRGEMQKKSVGAGEFYDLTLKVNECVEAINLLEKREPILDINNATKLESSISTDDSGYNKDMLTALGAGTVAACIEPNYDALIEEMRLIICKGFGVSSVTHSYVFIAKQILELLTSKGLK